jgi:hypothetical protein
MRSLRRGKGRIKNKEKLDNFLKQTILNVDEKERRNEENRQEMLNEIEDNIKLILMKSIEFSLQTNMIKKSGTSKESDIGCFKEGPPTFNETNKSSNHNVSQKSPSKVKKENLFELQSAIESGKAKNEIIRIIDKIIDERESLSVKKDKKPSFFNKTKNKISEKGAKEDSKRVETPNFDYAKLQENSNLLAIPPRDFKAYIPLLRILKLENYDRNIFENFNMVKSFKFLKRLWKTIDSKEIQGLIKYGIFHEVMKVEERKAVRRSNKEKAELEKERKKQNAREIKNASKIHRLASPFVRVKDLDSNLSKAPNSEQKRPRTAHEGDEEKHTKLSTDLQNESLKPTIKKWDSHGKGGKVKFGTTR